jgi:hypothetical protein
MENLAEDRQQVFDSESSHTTQQKFAVVPGRAQKRDLDSLAKDANNEIEARARQAMASNGFGDY